MAVALGVLFISIAIFLLSKPNIYIFRSDAEVDLRNTIVIEDQPSVAFMPVNDDQKPTCVESLYIAQSENGNCTISLKCNDMSKLNPALLERSTVLCSKSDVVVCTDSSSIIETCPTLETWLYRSAQACGCRPL